VSLATVSRVFVKVNGGWSASAEEKAGNNNTKLRDDRHAAVKQQYQVHINNP
jgi:hypothetical protein